MSRRVLLPAPIRLVDVLHVLTGDPREYLEEIVANGNHFWFRDDGAWEYQRPEEGGSMLCARVPHVDPEAAWVALRDAGLLPDALFSSDARRFAGRCEPACDRSPRRDCAACEGADGTPMPGSFPLVFALACAPDAALSAERALGRLAVALGEAPPSTVTWRLAVASVFALEPALLARLVGIDRELTSREPLVHLHGETGIHPEWPVEAGHGDLPLSAFERATLAHRAGGIDAIASIDDARHAALRALLETGFGLPCDLGRAVRHGSLLAAQPFDLA